ncbi:XRE family transcriptional regulator [Nitrosovibrio tenuis]|nr:XRE family transcriptional regulator [Nitrosovibrio tenuis]
MDKNLILTLNEKANIKKFNPNRLTFARTRRGYKKADLAKKIGVTPRSMTGYESGEFPPELERLDQIAGALKFPRDFFFEEDPIEQIESDAVSFRAMSKMSATLKNMALGAGTIAVQLNSWIENKFQLPSPDLPELGRDIDSEAAAEALRKYWGLGEQAISNMVHLLEAKGVRVFSLAIEAKEVDAFSMWWDGTPFVFLNTQKSAEHSRFDAAHELGHLVMHRHGQPHGQEAEKEANTFASAFLMPSRSVMSKQFRFPTLDGLIKAKRYWSVSVAALNYRLHSLGLTSEWINRSLCIQISQAGYRTREPNEVQRETSQVLDKVFNALRTEGIGKGDIARDLKITPYEIDELTYGLLKIGPVPERDDVVRKNNSHQPPRPIFSIVK